MQLKILKYYILKVVKEGKEWQRKDVRNKDLQNGYFSQSQLVSFVISCLLVFFLKKGFSESFAGYIISFLSIFIGLFTTIIISLFDKSDTLQDKINEQLRLHKNNLEDSNKLSWLYKSTNYLKKFTALTSYSIYLAIVLIFLLIFTLLFSELNIDLSRIIISDKILNFKAISFFLKVSLVVIYRLVICYILCTFFVITTYSITSYFTFMSKNLNNKFNNND